MLKQPLELKVGNLEVFQEAMRSFNRQAHDGIILDDVRNLALLAEQQEKLRGKYDARVEFATSWDYSKYLFAVPITVSINHSTRNIDFLCTPMTG